MKLSQNILIIFLFVFISFAVLYYYDQYPILSRISNNYKYISIENILKQLPTCTPDDRSRQRALLNALHQWNSLARKYNLRYWIAYGTLVGYVQHCGLLPHDQDIDVLMMAQDTVQLVELSQLNFSSVYELKVHPQWYIVGEKKRSYFLADGIDFVAPNARFVNQKDHIHIDIWPIYDYHPDQTRIENNSKPMLTEYDENSTWKSSPKEWTFPLQECQFSGIKVWCPAQPEKMISHLYGESSFNVSSVQCVNGTWIKTGVYTSKKKSTASKEYSSTKVQRTEIQTTTVQLSNEQFIEKVLQSIPVCTSNDRARQRYLLSGLQAWSQTAEKYNIQYWIAYGTLVGYVQRRGLLPHDQDVDVMMMSDDTPELIKVSQLNFSSIYEIKVQPQWKIIGEKYRSYFRKQGINFIAPNARFIHQKQRYHVDIFPAYDFNPLYANKSTENIISENITAYDLRYNWSSYPKNWIYPLQTCYFSEIKVLCPAKPEKLVSAVYGTKALTKSDTKCANGSWVDAK